MPSSAKCARKALISWVRCRIKRSRVRCRARFLANSEADWAVRMASCTELHDWDAAAPATLPPSRSCRSKKLFRLRDARSLDDSHELGAHFITLPPDDLEFILFFDAIVAGK